MVSRNRRSVQSSGSRGRSLAVEHLESRFLLSGDVTVQVNATFDLTLTGDSSGNQIEVTQGATADEFIITPLGTTRLYDGTTYYTSPLTVTGVTNDIKPNLKQGEDEFTIKDATVPNNLDITNGEGHNQNFLENVVVTKELKVTKTNNTYGKSELHVVDSTIIGDATVDNDGAGNNAQGESVTEFKHSKLSGKLTISNKEGEDIAKIIGSEITKDVSITNDKGGSRTVFTFYDPDTDVSGDEVGSTLHGKLDVTNKERTDQVTLNMTTVAGKATINNGKDRSEILITNGSQLQDELDVDNAEGFDSFAMNSSSVEKKVDIKNNNTTATFKGGSAIDILFSTIGTATSPATLTIDNDDGNDIVNILDSEVFGKLDIKLQKGSLSEVTLARDATIGGLAFDSDDGNETLTIEDTTITETTAIKLGVNDDFLRLVGATTFLKKATFNGEGGHDKFYLEPGVDFNGIAYDKSNFEEDV